MNLRLSLLWISFVVIKSQNIDEDPMCEAVTSGYWGYAVYCFNIYSWDDLNIAKRPHEDGLTDNDVTFLKFLSSEIPSVSEIFEIFPNLISLDLQFCSLTNLDESSLKNASMLETLYVGWNNITSVHNGTFAGAQKLKVLGLHDNQIKTIDSQTFAPLIHLEVLLLSNNQLTQIHPQTFHQLKNLIGLSLAENRISELHVSTFQQLTNLQELYLYGNALKSLDGTLLSSNKDLTTLDVNNCDIEAIERNFFDNLKLLSSMQVEGNVCVNKDFYSFTNISNILPALETCFYNYENPKPKTVVLCDYKVDPKLGYTCELRNVTYLNDTHSFSIDGIHINNQQDTDVKAVKFVNSILSKIPRVIFNKFPNLVRLDVKRVGLKKIDKNTFEECGVLEVFDASFNEITDISNNAFDKCESLTIINLSDNVLRSLRGQVFTGTKLESINLDGNKITAIEPCYNTLDKLPSLKFLSIKWNICIHNSYYNEHLNWDFNRLVTPDLKVCFTYWFWN